MSDIGNVPRWVEKLTKANKTFADVAGKEEAKIQASIDEWGDGAGSSSSAKKTTVAEEGVPPSDDGALVAEMAGSTMKANEVLAEIHGGSSTPELRQKAESCSDEQLALGKKLMKTHDYAQAAAAFKFAVKLDADNIEADKL